MVITGTLVQLKVPKPFAVSKRLLADMASSRCLAGVQALQSIDDFKQYSRVTLVVDDATDAQALTTGNAALMRFDIVAASPRSLSAFLHLCKQADVDIISLDFSHRMPFHIDQKHVRLCSVLPQSRVVFYIIRTIRLQVAAAVKRGILFEITHSPVTQSPATRRQLMESTRLVVEYMRGKQFILSSDAENLSQLRGPYDVLNIGCIIGLPEEQVTGGNSSLVVLDLIRALSTLIGPKELVRKLCSSSSARVFQKAAVYFRRNIVSARI